MQQDKSDYTSLNKYISSSGFCSRREADKLIEQGRVTINDELADVGAKVYPGEVVAIDGEPVKAKQKPVYIALNKPVGITSTTDPKDKSNIIYFLNHPKRIFPIGRLDKDSDGLIFLTNDGDIVNKILRASNNHEKEYIVTVNKAITPEFIRAMGEGIPMLGTVTRKCFVRQEGNKKFRIILVQGLNRQIRRMCEYLGYEVTKLTRVRIMNIKLDNLPVGKWRYLTATEIDKINDLVATSTKTEVKPVIEKKLNRQNAASEKKPTDKTKQPQAKANGQRQNNKEANAKPAKKTKSYKEWRNKR